MSEDAHLKKLHELEREGYATAIARGQPFVLALIDESDRGCAIVGASFVEDRLEALLRAVCRSDEESITQAVDPLFDSYGPFATFSGKIQAAFALRLIDRRLKGQLDLIRRMRNNFAHDQGPLSFEVGPCRDRLRALIETVVEEVRQGSGSVPPFPDVGGRAAFMFVVSGIIGQLEGRRSRVSSGIYPP
jgi:hypothetical protein